MVTGAGGSTSDADLRDSHASSIGPVVVCIVFVDGDVRDAGTC
jgi:hypothetical protein